VFEPFFTTKEVENQLVGMTFTVVLPLVGVLTCFIAIPWIAQAISSSHGDCHF